MPGAAAECRYAARCCRQSAVCALELGCWCRYKVHAARCCCQGAALDLVCWCRCRVATRCLERCLDFGASRCRCRVPNLGAAVTAVCALELGCSAGCCFQGAAVKVFGAWRWRVPLQGSAAGCCGQRYWVLVPLKCCPQIFFAIGVYAGVFFSKGLKAWKRLGDVGQS